ncbi:MAG: Uncharacterised protein [Flavobacteriaceae bacterium]|jgi:hypothetical protein|nr:MAG: Uncharacterised protein [Flavobacteriaceae bacterium]|tara:strand:- start:1184 stop:1333 length:150 start_codon:yes stop_codon:yes gene_type:complete
MLSLLISLLLSLGTGISEDITLIEAEEKLKTEHNIVLSGHEEWDDIGDI